MKQQEGEEGSGTVSNICEDSSIEQYFGERLSKTTEYDNQFYTSSDGRLKIVQKELFNYQKKMNKSFEQVMMVRCYAMAKTWEKSKLDKIKKLPE